MNDEGITAILAFVIMDNGGEVRIPYSKVVDGLPEGSFIRVGQDEVTDELVIKIVSDDG